MASVPESVTNPTKHLPLGPDGQPVYGFKPGSEDFPLQVVVSVSYACNTGNKLTAPGGCPNCPYNPISSNLRRDYAQANGTFVGTDLWRRIADEAGAHGAWLRMSGGGEPTLHPEFNYLVKYAKQRGCKIWLNTNGSRRSERSRGMSTITLDRAFLEGIDLVEFSVDAGDPETYAKVRPGLSWDILNANVAHALKVRPARGYRTRLVVSIIDQTECPDAAAAARYWHKVGVDKVIVRKFLRWQKNGRPLVQVGEARDATPYIDAKGEHGRPVPCPWPFERLNVDSTGRVAQCGNDLHFVSAAALGYVHRPDLPGGNQTIAEVWRGEHLEALRVAHLSGRGPKQPLCETCVDAVTKSWAWSWNRAVEGGASKSNA